MKETTIDGITFRAADLPATKQFTRARHAQSIPAMALQALNDMNADSALMYSQVRSCPKSQPGVPVRFHVRNSRFDNLGKRVFDVYAVRVPLSETLGLGAP